MKILLVDGAITGHRLLYMNALRDAAEKIGIECIRVLPVARLNEQVIAEYELTYPKKKNTVQYLYRRLLWIKHIYNIARKNDVDIIHFTAADAIYQLGGIGLTPSKKSQLFLVGTQHHRPNGRMRQILFRSLSRKIDKVVVHSEYLKKELITIGTSPEKIKVVHYPVFHARYELKTTEEARKVLGLPNDRPILLAIGGTRRGKGLDILLDALSEVNLPFYIVIAGKAEDISLAEINRKSSLYKDSVITVLRELTDAEFSYFIDATDCVVLPYRKSFNGASGPMTEALWRRKPIIGPNHGMIGDLIDRHHLGLSFESENIDDLSEKINLYLDTYKADKEASLGSHGNEYRESLKVERFIESYQNIYQEFLEGSDK